MDLFSQSGVKVEAKTQQVAVPSRKKHDVDYCLSVLMTDPYVWDMRAWTKHKDRNEVLEWVQQEVPEDKNCGHPVYCIKRLKEEFNYDIEKIVDAIMENPKYHYKKAPVKCFYQDFDKPICPYWKGDYSETECWRCDGHSHNPMKVIAEVHEFQSLVKLSKENMFGISFETQIKGVWGKISSPAQKELLKNKEVKEFINKKLI